VGAFVTGLVGAPLDELVAAAQGEPSDDSPAMNEIVRRFEKRAQVIAATVTRRTALHDDLVQASLLALVRAVRRHQVGRPGFITYASKYMTFAAHRSLAAWVGPMAEPASLSDPGVAAAASAIAAPVVTPGVRCWGYGRGAQAVLALPARQRELLTLRYVEDADLATIAAASGTSVPAVSQRLATAHRAVATQLAA